MTLKPHTPWTDLPLPPVGRYSRLLANATTYHQIIWFRDDTGAVGLLVEVDSSTTAAMLRDMHISIRDVIVEIRVLSEPEMIALALRLRDENKIDVFASLCRDIIDRVTRTEAGENIFQMVCRRLKKWQALFAENTNGLLNSAEIQGLYCELRFLEELITHYTISESVAVRSWSGPDHTAQDFVINETAIEIKSTAAHDRGKIQISSEDQLDTHLPRLYLHVSFVITLHNSDHGESLNEIVRRIAALITDESAKAAFENRLSTARYVDIPEYDSPHFIISETRLYQVRSNFPRIARSALPAGVESVSYDLVLAHAEQFRVSSIEFSEMR